MSSPSQVQPPAPPAQSTGNAAAPTNPAAAVTAAAGGDSSVASGNVSSMADLKEQAPEVYKAMLQGIAMNICRSMEDHQSRLKKLHEEARRQAEGG